MEASWRRSGVVVALSCIIFLALTCTGFVSGEYIQVGGPQKWKPNVNYTEWSANQHFHVGDWLYFLYDRKFFTVLEVNKTGYDTCSTDHILANYTNGAGRDVVQLYEARPYYFIDGVYCWNEMKFSILVEWAV